MAEPSFSPHSTPKASQQSIHDLLARRGNNRLAWEMESWSSIDLKIVMLHTNLTGEGHGKPYTSTIDEHYIETASGQRLSETTIHPPDGGERRSATYCDGKKCADVVHEGTYEEGYSSERGARQRQVIIKKTFGGEGRDAIREAPIPLKYMYVDMQPLHKMLPRAEHRGTETILGRPCEEFLFKNIRWNAGAVHLQYSLDGRTGVPLRVRCYADEAAFSAGMPLWEWEARSFDEIEGRHLALNSTLVAYEPAGRGQGLGPVKRAEWVAEAKEVHFDRAYAASVFWPKIELGASVWDQITGKSHVEGGPKQAIEAKPITTVANPIRASLPESWASSLSTIGIVLGLLAIAASLYIRRPKAAS